MPLCDGEVKYDGSVFAGDAQWYIYRCNVCGSGREEAGVWHYTIEPTVRFSMDGNMICATRPNFVNLQESPAGFGATPKEAKADLITNEEALDKKTT